MTEIIEYRNEYASDFKKLNLEWLDRYGLTESHDLMQLNDPEKTILEPGGFIWLAKEVNGAIVGTAALIRSGEQEFELAKMSVTEQWQGKGISNMLLETCLQKANESGAKTITLFSNDQLKAAIGLYLKYGFRHVEVKDSPFATANIKMVLDL